MGVAEPVPLTVYRLSVMLKMYERKYTRERRKRLGKYRKTEDMQ